MLSLFWMRDQALHILRVVTESLRCFIGFEDRWKSARGYRVPANDRETQARVPIAAVLGRHLCALVMLSQGASPEGCTHTLSFKKLSKARYFERWQVEVGCVFTQ